MTIVNAVLFQAHGDADVLQYTQAPTPQVKTGEALVRVQACGLNHLDLWIRQGVLGVSIPLPHIVGSEIVGTIAEINPESSRFKPGDRVLAAPGISCGGCPACLKGRDSQCPEFKIIGLQINGGYAEFAAVPEKNLIPIPEQGLRPEEWAAVPLVFLTAWHMLISRAGLQKGESVLIHAAGSGVGSAAIQIAKLHGAKVFTTVGSDEKIAKAKALGADSVINYKKADFAQETLRATKDQGVDVVLEHIGPATWAGSMRCLARGGRLVTCGMTSGPKVELDLRFFFTKELSVLGCYMGSRQELDQVVRLVANGRLKPVVDTVFPLADAAKAQALMESRNFFGKLVLKMTI